MATEGLDVGKDVVPASAVEAHDAPAQGVQDLIHLEHRGQGFDQHRHLHRTDRQAQTHFKKCQHLVPQRGFFHRLQLGQVKVGAAIASVQRLGVMQGKQGQIEQAGAEAFAIDGEVLFRQMPAAWSHHQHGVGVGAQGVVLAVVGGEGNVAGYGVAQVDLAFDEVGPGRTGGVLEIGHEHFGAGIERIDDHLAIDRAGDFHAPILQCRRDRRHAPVRFTNGTGVGAEVRQFPRVEHRLPGFTRLQQGLAPRLKAPMQFSQQRDRHRRQYALLSRYMLAGEFDTGMKRSVGHGVLLGAVQNREAHVALRLDICQDKCFNEVH